MTRHDIIKMAHEASPDMTWYAAIYEPDQASPEELDFLERFAALVRADEREACATACEEFYSIEWIAQDCAAAIRARGQT